MRGVNGAALVGHKHEGVKVESMVSIQCTSSTCLLNARRSREWCGLNHLDLSTSIHPPSTHSFPAQKFNFLSRFGRLQAPEGGTRTIRNVLPLWDAAPHRTQGSAGKKGRAVRGVNGAALVGHKHEGVQVESVVSCLLYTSDAADE